MMKVSADGQIVVHIIMIVTIAFMSCYIADGVILSIALHCIAAKRLTAMYGNSL